MRKYKNLSISFIILQTERVKILDTSFYHLVYVSLWVIRKNNENCIMKDLSTINYSLLKQVQKLKVYKG